MEVEIGRNALEDPGTVEDGRAQPGRVGARPDDGRIALDPTAVDPRSRFATNPPSHILRKAGVIERR